MTACIRVSPRMACVRTLYFISRQMKKMTREWQRTFSIAAHWAAPLCPNNALQIIRSGYFGLRFHVIR